MKRFINTLFGAIAIGYAAFRGDMIQSDLPKDNGMVGYNIYRKVR